MDGFILPARSSHGFPLGSVSFRGSAAARLPVAGLCRQAANHQHTVRRDRGTRRRRRGHHTVRKGFPGGYFHKTRTSMGLRLEHPMVARISLSGYATKELTLTEGPMLW